MIFDGRAFAKEIERIVKERVEAMSNKPKILSILVGQDPASELYTRLKKQAAERVGIEFEEVRLESHREIEKVIGSSDADGIMIQMPIPGLSREEMQDLVKLIPLEKDVDGLRWEESGVMPATVRAILSIIDKIAQSQIINSPILKSVRYVVVGSHGSVGKPLVHFLRKGGVGQITEVNSDTVEMKERILEGEVVISCTGRAGLITQEMVRPGVIAIDVGSPRGELTQGVYQKASVATPVPWGVGPVTVSCLMENAINLVL